MRRGQNAFKGVSRWGKGRRRRVAIQQAEERGAAEAESEPAEEIAAIHREVDMGAVHETRPLIIQPLIILIVSTIRRDSDVKIKIKPLIFTNLH